MSFRTQKFHDDVGDDDDSNGVSRGKEFGPQQSIKPVSEMFTSVWKINTFGHRRKLQKTHFIRLRSIETGEMAQWVELFAPKV